MSPLLIGEGSCVELLKESSFKLLPFCFLLYYQITILSIIPFKALGSLGINTFFLFASY